MEKQFSKFCGNGNKWYMLPPSYMFGANKYPCHLLSAVLTGYVGEGSPSLYFVGEVMKMGIPEENIVCYSKGTEREWYSFFGTKEQVAKIVVELNKRLRKIL